MISCDLIAPDLVTVFQMLFTLREGMREVFGMPI